jgi:hypothetical protein
MNYDPDKVDEMVLALLWLTATPEGRAWKGPDWDALDRLHGKGYTSTPRARPNVVLSVEGAQRARELFERHFGRTGK